MVDVTQSPSLSEEDATAFFTRAAENLGKAATEARVRRSVVLSIIGVDKIAAAETEPGTGFDGYYRAKFAQEQATLAFAPGPHVVRSSQFHDIARQAIGWGRDGDRSTIRDLTIQPVAVSAMVEVLLAVATGAADTDVTEVAGPQREQLADLSTRYGAHVGDPVSIVAAPVGDAVRHGILLPRSDLHQKVRQRRLKRGEVRKQIVCGNQVGDDVDRLEDVPLRDRKSNQNNTNSR